MYHWGMAICPAARALARLTHPTSGFCTLSHLDLVIRVSLQEFPLDNACLRVLKEVNSTVKAKVTLTVTGSQQPNGLRADSSSEGTGEDHVSAPEIPTKAAPPSPKDIFKVGSSIQRRSIGDSAGGTDRSVCWLSDRGFPQARVFRHIRRVRCSGLIKPQ